LIINHRKGESYQHSAAKAVFKYWLNSSNGKFGPFDWRGKVWEEYPFISYNEVQIWRERETSIIMKNPPIPTYEELAISNIKPIAIADIVIDHKGGIYYIVEIVHKHDISEQKIAKLKKISFGWETEIWRVEAHWILAQIERPTNFPEACIRRID